MSLENALMSSVLQVASRVFGRRAEMAFKESPNAGCIADLETALGSLTEVVLKYHGEHLARNSDNDICLVLEFDVASSLNGVRLTSVGELWLVIQALSSAERLSFDISLVYHDFTLTSSIPIPAEVQAEIDEEIHSNVSRLIGAIQVTLTLQSLFAKTMFIYGNPELTLVGGGSSPALAIGLEIYNPDPAIGRDSTVDRNHFTQNYNENLLQPAFEHDWAMQIESSLMEILLEEKFDNFVEFEISRSISGWKRTDYAKAYWSGNGLNWNYKGWKKYLEDNYWKHPVWLACKGVYDLKVGYPVFDFSDLRWETRYKHIDVGIYWFAYADLKVEYERILLEPYIFELGFRNGIYSTSPDISDISPIDVGPARFGGDFLVKQFYFTTKHLLIYGSDQHPEMLGYPDIHVPAEVSVDYLLVHEEVPGSGSMQCTGFRNEGMLEGESVLSQLEIRNLGEAPLWICSITMQEDTDAVFRLRLPANTPLQVETGVCISVDVLMTVPDDDHATHHGSIRVRCNDFDQPSALINVHGVKQHKASGRPVTCFGIADVRVSEEKLQRILGLIYGDIMKRHSELEEAFPPVPDPDPDPAPCPECGYYMDVAIAGLPPDASLELRDAKDDLVMRSQVLNDIHFFNVPLTEAKRFRYRMQPDAVSGKVIIKPGIGRITRMGVFRSEKKILELATDRTFVFVRHADGIDVVDIMNPRVPCQVSVIELKGCRNISKGNGFLYALTDDTLAVVDIGDPYSPNIAHNIRVERNSTLSIESNMIRVLDGEKARVYQVGLRTRLLKQYSIQEADSKKADLPGGHFPVIGKGIEQHRDRSGFPRRPFVLQDDYLLRIYDNGDAFEILRKDLVPFPLDRKLLKRLK